MIMVECTHYIYTILPAYHKYPFHYVNTLLKPKRKARELIAWLSWLSIMLLIIYNKCTWHTYIYIGSAYQ